MLGLTIWNQKLFAGLRACALLLLGIGLALEVQGCSLSGEKEKAMQTAGESAATTPKPPAGELMQPKTTAAERTLENQVFNVQELLVREEGGQTILQIKFSQPVNQFRHFPLTQPSRIVLDVFGKSERLAQLETFRVDTHWVGVLRLSSSEGYLRLVAEVAAAAVPAYAVTPEDGGLKIVIGAVNPNATTKKDLDLVRDGKRVDIKVTEAKPAVGQGKGQGSSSETPPAEEPTYTGQRISLDFKDADIKNVFRLLAEVSGLNIIVTDDVRQKVTIRIVDIPWDQALDLIVDTHGLAKEEAGNVMRISTTGRLEKERKDRAAAERAKESEEPLQTAYLTVNYARVIKGKDDKDATDKDLLDKVKAVLSPRGRIEADQRTNTLIVRDIKKAIEDVQALIAKLDVRTPQVLIESNLIETTPSFSRALGIEMEALFNNGRIRKSTRFAAGNPFEGAPQPAPADNLLIIPNSGFRFGYFGNNITGILSAAEEEGNVKIISRPSVVTLNNVESTIESANIIRVRRQAATVGEAGAIEQIRAGIILTVTPQVSADGFVLLKIMVKSSTLDFGRQVDGIPQENTREAKANVLVRDGETVVIGGIMKDNRSTSESGVPYLKDIPYLGWLFKKSSWQKDLEELVVFITPRIISAGSENLPTAEQLWRDNMAQTEGTVPLTNSQRP